MASTAEIKAGPLLRERSTCVTAVNSAVHRHVAKLGSFNVNVFLSQIGVQDHCIIFCDCLRGDLPPIATMLHPLPNLRVEACIDARAPHPSWLHPLLYMPLTNGVDFSVLRRVGPTGAYMRGLTNVPSFV